LEADLFAFLEKLRSISENSTMFTRRHSVTKNHIWSVMAATFFFMIIALALSFLMAKVVLTMRFAANEIDDHRAVNAAKSAIHAQETRLAGTVRDNAEWDDAYQAMLSKEAASWAFTNWGSTSENYPLYDAAVVTGPDGSVVSANMYGKPFDPFAEYGPLFPRHLAAARKSGRQQIPAYFSTPHGIVLAVSESIQPYSDTQPDQFHVLTLVKRLKLDVINDIAKDFQLPGLKLATQARDDQLSVAITDIDRNRIAYLVWPSQLPGQRIYDLVYPYILGAMVLLGVFLTAVLLAGSGEARRLLGLAETARHEARHDALSGLLNRAGLLGEIEKIAGATPAGENALLYLIDLDGFKAVNDAWGHAVGDELIRMVARALRTCHPEIVAISRLGGDEFALVQIGAASPETISTAVLALFDSPFQIGERNVEVGASIGYAPWAPAIDPLELLRRADMALYRAKQSGRGQSLAYSPELDRERERMSALEQQLLVSLQNEEIGIRFQPLVSATTGEFKGVEALARWTANEGPVSPEVFIPLAEKSGLIYRLGYQMLEKSMRHIKDMPGLSLSVNISPLQLCNPEFAGDVIALVNRLEFDTDRLTLEVTEGVLMSSPDQASRAIDALKAVGIRFALDDFGSGYASIGTLRQFGFDRMKIDRSLVNAFNDNGSGEQVLRATIALAAALNIPVTAEGVETRDQAIMLRDAGCDMLQGYGVGMPMSAADLPLYKGTSISAA
jgi:diguanylate cyclase (GGDEF)-like protein